MGRVLERAVEDSTDLASDRDRRYIYGGAPSGAAAGYAIRPNKKGIRRKASTFNTIMLLFGLGGAIVFYINNFITINLLSFEVNQLQLKYDRIMNVNATLRSEVNRKSTWERINPMAGDQLGLRSPLRQPVWFSIDWDKAHDLGVPPRNIK